MPRQANGGAERPKLKKTKNNGRTRIKSSMVGLTSSQMKLYDYFFWAKPIDPQDPDATELIERTDQYRRMCMELNLVPTMSDYAFVIGIKQPTLCAYRDGTRKASQKTREILQAVTRWAEAALSQVGFNNPMVGTYVIWLQKNYFGFRDNIDINVQQNQLMDGQSAQDVMKRYKFIEASVVTPEIEQKETAAVEVVAVQEKEEV